jgi:hypothetical protein
MKYKLNPPNIPSPLSILGLFEAPRAKKAKYSPFDKLREKKKQLKEAQKPVKKIAGRDKYFATKNSTKSPRTNSKFGKRR